MAQTIPEETLRSNPVDPAFESESPYKLAPADFRDFPDPKSFEERLEAALEFIPLGEDVDFDQLLNGIVLEEK